MLAPRSFSSSMYGFYAASARVLMWVALAAIPPGVKWALKRVDAFTLNVCVVLLGMVGDAASLVLLATVLNRTLIFFSMSDSL